MKLRLTAKGFETYTGQMGVISFVDGLSIGDVLAIDAVRVAGIIGAEWEDGTPANVSQRYLDNMHTPAPVFLDADAPTIDPAALEQAVAKAQAAGKTYMEEELAAIADKDGIAGLRVIADSLAIKGNSIRGLIDAILKAAPAPKESQAPAIDEAPKAE